MTTTVEPTAESSILLPNFDPASVRTSLIREIATQERALKRVDALEAFFQERLSAAALAGFSWPEGATIKLNEYDVRWCDLQVSIAHNPDRPWRGSGGTADTVYRIRKFFGVKKLERYDYSRIGLSAPQTDFYGNLTIDGEYFSLHIRCEGTVPDTCRLEEVTETRTITDTRFKIVCK